MAELIRIVGANDIDVGNGWWTGSTPPPAGSTLSRILRSGGHSYDMVVARQGEPLLDSELNLMQQIVGEKLDRFVHQLALTGWTKAPGYPVPSGPAITTSTAEIQWNSAFNTLTFMSDAWLVAKGMFIHVTNPDLLAPDGGYQIELFDPAPTAGVIREDLLFIEFWFEEVGPDGIGLTDSASRSILKEGGIGNGIFPQSDVNESLVDPLLNIETTRRVQLRWRLRAEPSTGSPVGGTISMFNNNYQGVGGRSFAWGLSSNTGTPNADINAMGANSSSVANYPFHVVESPPSLSDPTGAPPFLLWRTAVPVDPKVAASALKTVDGYSYAVPMLKLIRDSGNGLHAADLRTPSRLYIPDHSLHARQLAPGDALNGAGVTGGLSTNGTVIEPETIEGGVGGDVGPHTITSYNLAAGTVDEDALGDNVVNIENINANVGLPTILLTNNTAERVYNGSVVFVVGSTFVKSDAADPVTLPIMGVVQHHVRNSAQDYIEPGTQGFVRLAGLSAKTLTSGTVSVNNFLIPALPTVASYYPAVAGVINAFGQVIRTYAHDPADPVGMNRADVLMFGEIIPNASIDSTKIKNAVVKLVHIHAELITGGDDDALLRKLGRSGTIHENDTDRALPADDERLSNSRPPTGPAGGDLTGEYPNPTIAAGAVTTSKIAEDTIVPGNVNPANVNGIASAPSLRSLSVISGALGGGIFAVSDDSPALTNARIPTGTAGGVLTGTYPNPVALAAGSVLTATVADGNITNSKLAANAVGTGNIIDGAVTTAKHADASVSTVKLIDLSVTNPKLAVNAVGSINIQTGAADYTKIGVIPALRVRRISSPDGDQAFSSTSFPGSGTGLGSAILWATAQIDTLAGASLPQWSAGSPNIISVRVPGLYYLSLTVAWIDQGPSGRGDLTSIRGIGIATVVGNTAIAYDRVLPNNFNTLNSVQNCNTLYRFTSPTTLFCGVQQNSGVPQSIGGDTDWATVFQMVWVGPV